MLTLVVNVAMSITWLVLVLPATFAEVIGLSLVKPGRNGYLDVQIYTGFMFTAAFLSRKSQPSQGSAMRKMLITGGLSVDFENSQDACFGSLCTCGRAKRKGYPEC